MKKLFQNFFGPMHFGARLIIFLYALGFPVSWACARAGWFNLYDWLAFSPALAWHGEVWSAVTYPFLAGGIIDWVVSLFWFATLVSVLCRAWSGLQLWGYCLLTAASAALLLAVLAPSMKDGIVGNAAMIFGLLAAWDRIYRRERLVLLGVGEISVRQAVILIALIEGLVLFFWVGWLVTLAMIGGGAVGWLCLIILGKRALNRPSEVVDSERIARLEL